MELNRRHHNFCVVVESVVSVGNGHYFVSTRRDMSPLELRCVTRDKIITEIWPGFHIPIRVCMGGTITHSVVV